MKKYYLIFAIFISIYPVFGANIPDSDINKIVLAIKKIENSKIYPFGIKSIEIKGKTPAEREAYAQKVCRQTVINNFSRYKNQNIYTNYFIFLGSRYAPIGAPDDPRNLNSNWVKNIQAILGKEFVDRINKKLRD